MEPSTEEKKPSGPSTKTVIIIAAILIAGVIAAAAMVLAYSSAQKSDGLTIGYSTEAKVMLDQAALQAAMDEAARNANDRNIALEYDNNAYSTNGSDFRCYIVNSALNAYDMFLAVYTDAGLTDQVFLSELVPPGSGFENITLNRALEVGDHQLYVALTQVKISEESGEQVLHNQVLHTMDFHVFDEE